MANRKLTDTQLVILSTAGARDDGLVLPLPKSGRVNRGTQTIVLRALLSKDLIAARPAQPGEEVWETHEDGSRTTLEITEAGFAAVGIIPDSRDSSGGAPETKPGKGKAETGAGGHERKTKRAPADKPAPAARTEPAKDTKLGILIATLRRKRGATIDEMMEATGWQAHSVRGAISGALKKLLGLEVASAAVDGRGRVYRFGGVAA
jgi:hypothetical protein